MSYNEILIGCFQPWKMLNRESEVLINLAAEKKSRGEVTKPELLTFRNNIYRFDKGGLLDPEIFGSNYVWKCVQCTNENSSPSQEKCVKCQGGEFMVYTNDNCFGHITLCIQGTFKTRDQSTINKVAIISSKRRPVKCLIFDNSQIKLDFGSINNTYRKLVNRNNRLQRLIELNAPEIIIKNEVRLLQDVIFTVEDLKIYDTFK